ncbi:conjugal transfer protein [Streptomyces sp. HNM0663]|uniref:Conjugal transfer protein n=1 Tax=Streptomyces chengmaiensis TaxID=3040919 RepID=A0ABT6HTZ2_9ACTN|nr:conjugal transfer protein [Streptomyces chengmaiensis]MDH2392189.1 conjugal transfer protein [Streptomyces chengmaiensis]
MKMSAWTRRPPKGAATRPDEVEPQDWDIDEGPQDVAGWSTGAQANMSAAIRWTAWGLLILGPLLGAAAYLSAPAQAGPSQNKPAQAAPATTGAQGAAGFAQLFVAAFIEAGEGDQAKLAAYYPDATGLRLEGDPGRRRGEQLTVVRLRQTDRGVWSVTVAARVTDTKPAKPSAGDRTDDKGDAKATAARAVRYFQAPVATAPTAGGASGYTALAMPAEVAAPERIKAPALVYGPMRPALPADPRTQAVTEFLSAYLTGTGELDRYLAPGTTLTAIAPAPYTGIAVDTLAIEGERGSEPVMTVPGDGTTLRLLVALRATGRDEVRVPLTYALTLKARAGRWEIASLDGAPAPAGPAAPAASSVPLSTPSPIPATTEPASADRTKTAATQGSQP